MWVLRWEHLVNVTHWLPFFFFLLQGLKTPSFVSWWSSSLLTTRSSWRSWLGRSSPHRKPHLSEDRRLRLKDMLFCFWFFRLDRMFFSLSGGVSQLWLNIKQSYNAFASCFVLFTATYNTLISTCHHIKHIFWTRTAHFSVSSGSWKH